MAIDRQRQVSWRTCPAFHLLRPLIMAVITEHSTITQPTAESDPTARTEMRVQPPGEVERREEYESTDRNQRPILPPHTEAGVAPSAYFDRDRIASLAYRYWLDRRGLKGGSTEEYWLRAEAMLRERALGY